MANLMYETATLRSGFMLQDTATFASRVEQLLRQSLGVPESAPVEEDEDLDSEEPAADTPLVEIKDESEEQDKNQDEHDELWKTFDTNTVYSMIIISFIYCNWKRLGMDSSPDSFEHRFAPSGSRTGWTWCCCLSSRS